MRVRSVFASLAFALALSGAAQSQVPPVAAPDQLALLKSSDPKLAANKKLVFDVYREVINGGHLENVEKYFRKDYIQHNPNVVTGRDAMVAYMKSTRPVRPVPPTIAFPVVSIMAEGDLVLVATVAYADDPDNKGQRYASTHFDLFRIDNGQIAEHWDNVPKSKEALHTDPNLTTKP